MKKFIFGVSETKHSDPQPVGRENPAAGIFTMFKRKSRGKTTPKNWNQDSIEQNLKNIFTYAVSRQAKRNEKNYQKLFATFGNKVLIASS